MRKAILEEVAQRIEDAIRHALHSTPPTSISVPGLANIRFESGTDKNGHAIGGGEVSPQAKMRRIVRNGILEAAQQLSMHAPGVVAISSDFTPPQSLVDTILGGIVRADALERLTPEGQQAVRRLGVFHGGAFETAVLAITGLGDASEGRREVIEQIFARLEQGDRTAVDAYYQWIAGSAEAKAAREQEPTPPQLLKPVRRDADGWFVWRAGTRCWRYGPRG